MLTHARNGVIQIQHAHELSELAGAIDCRELFLDLETTSGDPREKSTNPWRHCSLLGVCVTWDDHPRAYYIPVRHHHGQNVEWPAVREWLREVMRRGNDDGNDERYQWVNHNIKYDAHVVANELEEVPRRRLVCTRELAKVYDSDRRYRGGYGLDALSMTLLDEDISSYEAAMQPYLVKNRDYGAIPADVMAPYGGQDVITGRRLHRFLAANTDAQCNGIRETEIESTRMLLEAERVGHRVEPAELRKTEFVCLTKMMTIDQRMQERVGFAFDAKSNDHCYDVLCNKYGLPVVAWTDEDDDGAPAGNPSFDKHALKQYLANPVAPRELIRDMLEYRKFSQFVSLFVVPYQKLNVDGVLHPTYNQQVTTGRMSCGEPNMQQLGSMAKELILPNWPGWSIVTCDASQVEFRFIVHYINDRACIEAYERDPWTDFHQWVADMIPMPRKPAKNVNFMLGYGGGKKKCVLMLASHEDVLRDVVETLAKRGVGEASGADVSAMVNDRALTLYDKYHATLPGLKRTTRAAAATLEARGYVFNIYGRWRRLNTDFAHKAFNTLCQSGAADLFKERLVALRRALRAARVPCHIIGAVHDQALLLAPTELAQDARFERDVVAILQNPAADLRVPIRWTYGHSDISWAQADEASRNSEQPVGESFSWYS